MMALQHSGNHSRHLMLLLVGKSKRDTWELIKAGSAQFCYGSANVVAYLLAISRLTL